jgi:phosphonate transport system substrate-binding protein
MLWRKDLDADTKQKVRAFFLGYGRDAREKAIMNTLTFGGFVPSDNNQLLPIRQLELARERSKVQADAQMATEARDKRLQEIDARLADLSRQMTAAN